MDVREHAAARDGHAAEELVELLVVADGELDVARDDARLLSEKSRFCPEALFQKSGSFRIVIFGYNI